MLNDLTTLQCFPEDLLIEFFNIDTIHDLEKFMEGLILYLSMKAQKMLMQVNRCVAIECPHLDIPWFHDHFCKDNIETLNTTSKKLIHEVNELLEQILNGPLFIQKNSYSPFYHKFDFECALNKKKKPVPAALFNDKYEASIQRYAICVLSESSYCKNGKFLNGKECVRKRHLQLLGYKFIEVPFFEWYSMGLTEKLTKKKYLEDKIFKNS
ncbi:hypothetical protein HELRODRAFT_72935 [Helobdella robusta]|uniref:RAP domain-containing protein n=1 Tax=Helobdella robusta TaxID=6412 RepID=T1G174_HELRO|nr:hypothetical protein HELRODRAFT_72935 [Helobdella robusta]ESO10013.1 hypothetical protein HELRODRAFT_72935 [Helobdella robusta]